MCDHVKNKWGNLKVSVLKEANEEVCVKLSQFKTAEYKKKNGEVGKRLELFNEDSNLEQISAFIDDLLPSILHHRNQLKNYRNTIKHLRDNIRGTFIDIDFSEKLKIPTQEQAQSQHWCEKTAIVHSGIMKEAGEKSYHAYLSDDVYQDQVFVNIVLDKMLEESKLEEGETLVIESDNCTSQYKSAEHFDGLVKLATRNNVKIIRIYGVAGHGKGEVDHVGGIAKVCRPKAKDC